MLEEGLYTCLVDFPPYEGVGEHSGQELFLMRQGRKPLAFFTDILPSRRFLYEHLFDPYVDAERETKIGQLLGYRPENVCLFVEANLSEPRCVERLEEALSAQTHPKVVRRFEGCRKGPEGPGEVVTVEVYEPVQDCETSGWYAPFSHPDWDRGHFLRHSFDTPEEALQEVIGLVERSKG